LTGNIVVDDEIIADPSDEDALFLQRVTWEAVRNR